MTHLPTQLARKLINTTNARGLLAVAICGAATLAITPASALAQDDSASFWTQFAPSEDTRLIFVSSSEGNDNNSGLTPAEPVASLAKAQELVRDGYPDWVLLRRGDTWEHGFGTWEKSGRSADERVIIGAYGEDQVRPRVSIAESSGFTTKHAQELNNIALVGIRFEGSLQHPSASGVAIIGYGSSILIEDCYIGAGSGNLSLHANGGRGSNYAVRGCIIVDSWSTEGHNQGLLAKDIDGLVIEENIFDRNGWNPEVPGAEPTMFNQNVYIQMNVTDVVFVGNLTSRASGAGVQLRPGAYAASNLVYANPVGMRFGYHGLDWPENGATGKFESNVILGGPMSDNSMAGAGIGIIIDKVADGEFVNNTIAHFGEGQNQWAIQVSGEVGDLDISHNTVYNWNLPGSSDGIAVRATAALHGNMRVADNMLYMPGSSKVIVQSETIGLEYNNNAYEGVTPSDDAFRVTDTWMSFQAWDNLGFVYGDQVGTIQFTDPSRDLDAYARHLGYQNADEFLQAARSLSRSNWNHSLTGRAAAEWIGAGFAIEE